MRTIFVSISLTALAWATLGAMMLQWRAGGHILTLLFCAAVAGWIAGRVAPDDGDDLP